MKFLILSIFLSMIVTPSYKINFGQNGSGSNWQIINDGVMGGLSEGVAEVTKETLFFQGKVSLENNGGFSSLRGPFKKYDLSNFKIVKIKYRSTGQDIAFRMELDQRWFMPAFKENLPETANEWHTIKLPLTEFKEYRIGRATGQTMSTEKLASVIRLGFITNTKKACAFEFEVDYMEFE